MAHEFSRNLILAKLSENKVVNVPIEPALLTLLVPRVTNINFLLTISVMVSQVERL